MKIDKKCKLCGADFLIESWKVLDSGNFCSRSCSCKFNSSKHNCATDNLWTGAYRSWVSMKQRCDNRAHISWNNYGGAGISYAEEWRSFENFLKDMGDRPIGMTLDRIEPNGDYSPSNCRWACAKQQGRNKRNNHVVDYMGHTRTLSEVSELCGVSFSTLHGRLKRGWTIEEATTIAPFSGNRRKTPSKLRQLHSAAPISL